MLTGMTTEELYGFIVIYVFLAGLVALLARATGKSPVTGFALSLLLSPLIGFLWAVLSSGPKGPANSVVCTNCGAALYQQWWSNSMRAYECRHCKAVTPGKPVAPEPSAQITGRPQTIASGPTPPPESRFCPQCGTPRTGTLPHCANCGYRFDQRAP
jgi:hypothetical protein